MTGNFGNIVQKAFYLGVGLASYAGEQAKGKLQEVRLQAQKLADEMVARGEMTTEEARRFVDDLVQQAQVQQQTNQPQDTSPAQPRQIEILEEDEEVPSSENAEDVDELRKQVEALQEQLRQLNRE
jgi:polyhydroxyalkanoate synthesis regulator phasin